MDELIQIPSGLLLSGSSSTLYATGSCVTCSQTHGESGCTMQCGQCGQGCYSQGCTSGQGCDTCQSGQTSTLPAGSITSVSSTATSITVNYASISGADWYQVVYRKTSDSSLSYIANASNLSCTITGLEPNTNYTVNYRAVSASGEFGSFTTGQTIDTKSPTPASFSIAEINQTDITLRVLIGDSSEFIIYCTTPAGTVIYNEVITRTANFYYTISGLIPNTNYKVNVHYDVGDSWCGVVAFTTASNRPNDWSWGYNVIPGARLPTALEWDNFCSRINEFLEYRGLAIYSFTAAYPGPTTLTAAMVNQTINAISTMSPSIAPPAAAIKNTTKLSASLMNGLANSLNSVV